MGSRHGVHQLGLVREDVSIDLEEENRVREREAAGQLKRKES